LAGETFNRYHITLRRAAPVSGTQEQ